MSAVQQRAEKHNVNRAPSKPPPPPTIEEIVGTEHFLIVYQTILEVTAAKERQCKNGRAYGNSGHNVKIKI